MLSLRAMKYAMKLQLETAYTQFFVDYGHFYPEIILTIGIISLTLLGFYISQRYIAIGSILVLIVALIAVIYKFFDYASPLSGLAVIDAYTQFFKLSVLLGTLYLFINSSGYFNTKEQRIYEYNIIILFSVLGMCVTVSANEILLLFIGIELQGLSLYLLTAVNRNSLGATFSALLYMIAGTVASLFLLFGLLGIYKWTGIPTFLQLSVVAGQSIPLGALLPMTIGFITTGFMMKLPTAPFHYWAPDVYKNAPTITLSFLATIPKISIIGIMIRVYIEIFGKAEVPNFSALFIVFGLCSMFVGAAGAMYSEEVKDFLAYSTINNMGLILLGFGGTLNHLSISGLITYTVIYVIMTMGAFATMLCVPKAVTFDDYSGLGVQNPVFGTILSFILFAIAGVPPLAGFYIKYYILISMTAPVLWPTVVAALIASFAITYAYVKFITILFEEGKNKDKPKFEIHVSVTQFYIIGFTLFVIIFLFADTSLFHDAVIIAPKS